MQSKTQCNAKQNTMQCKAKHNAMQSKTQCNAKQNTMQCNACEYTESYMMSDQLCRCRVHTINREKNFATTATTPSSRYELRNVNRSTHSSHLRHQPTRHLHHTPPPAPLKVPAHQDTATLLLANSSIRRWRVRSVARFNGL